MKRKIRWMGGGLIVVITMFAAGAFFIEYNSLESRVDRVVKRLVDEVGFKKTGEESYPKMSVETGTVEEFIRPPMDEDELLQALSIVSKECPSLEYDTYVQNQNSDTTVQIHRLRLADENGDWIVQIGLVPVNKDNRLTGPAATLALIRTQKPSLWQQISSWSPW